MAFKFVILAAFIAVAQASVLGSDLLLSAPTLAVDSQYARLAPLEARYQPSEGHNPAYEFKYGVHDQFTGDSKSAHEIRNGDIVQGTYSLNDPDGTRRTVDYTSTPNTGFQATVRKEPLVEGVSLPSEPILAKTIVESPVELRRFESAPSVELRRIESAPSVELRRFETGPILSAPASYVEPQLLRHYSAPALVRSNLHLAPELRLAAAPALRYTQPLVAAYSAPLAYTRNDAGLTSEVLSGYAAGTRSFTSTGPLVRSW